jgi:nitroreductase
MSMNETIMNILGRRSIRSYTAEPVEEDKLELILKCGIYSPTGRGIQPWYFTVVKNRTLLDEISAVNKRLAATGSDPYYKKSATDKNYDNFRGAPMAIIASGKNGEKYNEVDCANAITNMCVAAHSLGLGSCYIASFRPAFSTPEGNAIKKKLGIPESYIPFFAISLGYIKEPPQERAARREGIINTVE